MVDADSFFHVGDIDSMALFTLIGKMLQSQGLLYDENHGAF